MNIKLNLNSSIRIFISYYALGVVICIASVISVHFSENPIYDSFIFRLFLHFSDYRQALDSIASNIGLSGWVIHNALLVALLSTAWFLNIHFPIEHFFKLKELMKRTNITLLGVAAFISSVHLTFVLSEEIILPREIKKIENENLRLEMKFEGLMALKSIYVTNASEEKKLELISAGHYTYKKMLVRYLATQYIDYNYSESVINILEQHNYELKGSRLYSGVNVKLPLKARIDRLEIQKVSLTESAIKSPLSFESKRNQLLDKSIDSGITEFVKEITLGGLGVEFQAETKFFVEELISELATFFFRKSLRKIKEPWVLERFKSGIQPANESWKALSRESMLYHNRQLMEDFRITKYNAVIPSVNKSTGLIVKESLSQPFKNILREIEFTNIQNHRIAQGPTIEEIKRRHEYRIKRLRVVRR